MDTLFRPNAGGTQAWVEVAEEHGFILVVPNGFNPGSGSTTGNDQRWNDCRNDPEVSVPLSTADDTGFLQRLIASFHASHATDPGAVFATGVSNGGMMTLRLATELPEEIRAGAAFLAQEPALSACPPPSRPVPMMILVGTDDAFMPFEGGSIPGGRGLVRSARETVERWSEANGTGTEPLEVISYPSLQPDDATSVTCRRYGGAGGGERVRYCVVEGGGHVTPSIRHPIAPWVARLLGAQNRDLESAQEAWSFFAQFR